MILRAATRADAPQIAAIYGHYVRESVVTFEEVVPTEAQMAARIDDVLALGLPYLVAEAARGRIDGFAYASPFRMRAAYRYTAEDTVYVRPGESGRGLGRALVGGVVEVCEAQGLRQLVAVIGDSANAASIGVHRALGFKEAGVCEGFGYKFGRWVDVVLMQRALNGGTEGEPATPGLAL